MNSAEWISRNVSHWIPTSVSWRKLARVADKQTSAASPVDAVGAVVQSSKHPVAALRSTTQRLAASLRRGEETMSPRHLRNTLAQLRAILDERVSEVEGGRRAAEFAAWYAKAPLAQRRDCWLLMSEQFAPDAAQVAAAHARYASVRETAQAGAAEVALRQALESPRARLLQRFAAFDCGVRFLVDLRAQLLLESHDDPCLLALDGELEALFSTWFDVAFLELRRICWDSPASLLEKLIQYEAVHDIRGWSDLKNRLDSDRRCYGFFHPRLPNEPLIFVEVALLDALPQTIAPLLDESAAAADIHKAQCAIFYSISNTQRGLHGVSFGDSLIKQVVETLKWEFAQLKVFATLSPMPGFRYWLGQNAQRMVDGLEDKARAALAAELCNAKFVAADLLAAAQRAAQLDEKSALRQWLAQCAAHYLGHELRHGRPVDPVARFHLGNGARIERINWGGDFSDKGLRQSYGMMVNYLYDLKLLDRHRSQFANGKMALSSQVRALRF
ncbi:MAG: malonyl-CoA decarboxylase [Comamonadaceae bacterium CG1_02_60_18]|nr:MAG: malonyl-CoA decarboxylase [Comamonadaceae bacterium CG1_02_60_18]PIQ50922.1 MAG: malonyl-CoA decarboxylase [Comamonadaceae bacterium CG12_big_fil_rev_8_21_14_0_65_59_15]